MAARANFRDLLTAKAAEGLGAILKVLAGFSRIEARLRTCIQWRPLLQDLALEVDAIGEVFRKQYDLTASIRVAPVDWFGVLRTAGMLHSTLNGKGGNRQGASYHGLGLNRQKAR